MRFLLFIGLLLLVLLNSGCTGGPAVNKTTSVTIGGICERCPPVRLDTLLTRLEGVGHVKIDTAQSSAIVDYDSTRISYASLVAILNDAGYDADDSPAFSPGLLDACCQVDPLLIRRGGKLAKGERRGARDAGASLKDNPFNLDADELGSDEDDELLNQMESQAMRSGDMIESEMDKELEAILEEDILNEVEMNAIDPLALDDDLEDEIITED